MLEQVGGGGGAEGGIAGTFLGLILGRAGN